MAESVNEKIQSLRKKYGYSAGGTGSEVSPKISELRKKYGYKSGGDGENFAPPVAAAAPQADPQIVGGTGLGVGVNLPTQQQANSAMAQVAKQNHEKAQGRVDEMQGDFGTMASVAFDKAAKFIGDNFVNTIAPVEKSDRTEQYDEAVYDRNKAARDYYTYAGREAVGKVLANQQAGQAFSDAVAAAVEALSIHDKYRNGGWDNAATSAVTGAYERQASAVNLLVKAGIDKETAERAVEYQAQQIRAGKAQEKAQATQQWADEHEGAASLMSLVAKQTGGLDFVNALARNQGHNSTKDIENYRPLTSADFQNTTYAEALQSGASADLGAIGKVIYDITMSMADSAFRAYLLGPISGVLSGSSVAASMANDALARGGTNGQALTLGFAAGAAEMIFETISVGMLLNADSPTTWMQWLKSIPLQGGVEASEELFTEAANLLSDAVIMGKNSSFNTAVKAYQRDGMSEEAAQKKAFLDNLGQVALSMVGGFISGGLMSAGKGAPSVVANRSYQNYLSKAFSQDRVSVLSVAQEYAEGSKTRALAESIHAAVKTAMDTNTEVKVRDNLWGRLIQSMENEKAEFGPKLENGTTDPVVEQTLHPGEAVMSLSAQAFMDAGDDAPTADLKSRIFDRIRNGERVNNADLRTLDLDSASTRAAFKNVLGVELPPVNDSHQLMRAARNAARSISEANAQAQAQQAEVQERVAENEQVISEAEQQARAIEAEAAEMANRIPQLAEMEQGVQADTAVGADEQNRGSLGAIPTATNVPQAGVSGAVKSPARSLLDYVTNVHNENATVRARTQNMTVQALNQMLEGKGSRSRIELVHDGGNGFNAQWTPDGKIQVNADRLNSQFAIYFTLTHELFHEASKQKGGEESEWTRAAAKELIALGESGKVKMPGYASWGAYKAATREAQIQQHMKSGMTRQMAEAKLTEDFMNEEYAADVLRSVFAQTGNLKLFASEHRTTLTKIRDWLQARFTELLKGDAENKGDLLTEMNDLVKRVNEALTKGAESGTMKKNDAQQEVRFSGREESTDHRERQDAGRVDRGQQTGHLGGRRDAEGRLHRSGDLGAHEGDLIPKETRRIMNEKGIPDLGLRETHDRSAFSNALDAAKAANPNGGMVDSQSVEWLEQSSARMFMREDGLAGVAVESDGNIVGVFKHPDLKVTLAVNDLLCTAIANGGTHLDCYATYGISDLRTKYALLGFRPVAYLEFNREYAAEDWNYAAWGEPDVVMWVHNGASIEEMLNREEPYAVPTRDAIHELEKFEDYDEAKAKQKSEIGRTDASGQNSTDVRYSVDSKTPFREQVRAALAEDPKENRFNALYIAETPNLLAEVGLGDLPMCMTASHVRDINHQKGADYHWHGIPEGLIARLPELLSQPVMILSSDTRWGDVVVATAAVDNDGHPVLVSIRPNGSANVDGVKGPANFITSMYGKDRDFTGWIEKNAQNGRVLYWNRKRTQQLFRLARLQLPAALTTLSSDTILKQHEGYVKEKIPERKFSVGGRPLADPLYSQMERVLNEYKGEKIGATSLIPYLKNHGVKQEEIKWSGIEQFLEGKKSVTKDELFEFLRANELVIEDVVQKDIADADIQLTDEEQERVNYANNHVKELTAKLGEQIKEAGYLDVSAEWELAANAPDWANDFGGTYADTGRLSYEDYARIANAAFETIQKEMRDRLEPEPEVWKFRDIAVRNDLLGFDFAYDATDALRRNPLNYEVESEEDQQFLRDYAELKKRNSEARINFKAQDYYKKLSSIQAVAERAQYLLGEEGRIRSQARNRYPTPRYRSYATRGGNAENYREVLFRLPEVGGGLVSPHWEQDDVLAHTRLQDMVDAEGKKVLFVDEVQSDWHQEGRDSGYRPSLQDAELIDKGWHYALRVNGEEFQNILSVERLNELYESDNYTVKDMNHSSKEAFAKEFLFHQYAVRAYDKVPDAPYRDTWHEYVLKRVLRMAAEGGYDKVAWTTGQMQADRYHLGRYIDEIEVANNGEGGYFISAGEQYHDQTPEQVIALLGHDLGKRAMAKADELTPYEVETLEGAELEIGGEGMKNFYDVGGKSSQNIPKFLNKYLKPWGVKVQSSLVGKDLTGSSAYRDGGMEAVMRIYQSGMHNMDNLWMVPSVDITDQMRDDLLYKGQPRYSVDPQFAASVDEWDGVRDTYFRLGTTSGVLQSLGVADKNIVLRSSKLTEVLSKHKGMTRDIIKQVPNILERPLMVLNSRSATPENRDKSSRIVLFGEVYDENGDPVTAVLDLRPTIGGGEVQDYNLLVSAYGKNKNLHGMVEASEVLYLDPDKNRTDTWLHGLGLQLPSFETKYGSMGSISYNGDFVNIKGTPWPELPKRDTKYSVSGKPRTGGNTGNVNPETGFQRGSVADSFMRMWNVGAQDEALSMLESVITRLAQLEADASERRLADLRRAVLSPRVTENVAERNRERIERLIDKYGMMPQTSAAQQEVRLPEQIDDETYVAGAVQTVMAAGVTTELIRDELAQDILSGNAGVTYARIGDPATLEQVDKEYEKYGHDAMMTQWKNKFTGNEAIGKLDIARAEKLYVEMASSKDPDMGAVLELVAEIAAAGTQAGQAVQAMTLLKKMTPTGQLYYIQKAVDRLNKDPRQKSPIIINVKLAEKLAKARTREEINAAIDELINDIAQQVPVSLPDKWNTWRYFAMLGNPRTHIRNLMGNAVFAPARLAKDAIGTLLEKALPQNQRTKALTASEALREFAEQDAVEMQDILRGGGKYNPSDMIRDKRKIFKRAEWLNKATQKNSELLEKEDWVFLGRAYQRSLAGFLSARGVTDADTLLDTPEGRKTLNEARIYAVHEAQRATYRDMSKLAGTLNHLKRNHKALGIFLDGIVPFTKTPINIVKRGIEYSPLGLVKTIYDVVNRGVAVKQIGDGKTVKRDFKGAAEIIDELSANLTGTGVALVGVLLSHLGLLTAGLGADDEDKFKELYGEQAYSLNIPGVGSYTIDWMAPVALPLFVGAEIYNTLTADYSDVDAEQVLDAVMDGMASILEPMLSLSMLDGLNDALSANKYGDSEDAIWTLLSTVGTSYVAQGVPTVMGQLSRTLDSDRRTTFVKKGEGDVKGMLKRFWQSSVQGKIPFYENEKMAYIDAWGRADTTGSVLVRAFENFLSPGYINSNRKTDVEAELERLAAALKDTGVMPDRAQKYFTVNKETYAMSQDEYQAHLIDRGQTSYALVNDFLHDPAYDRMDDAGRAKVINDIYDYAAQSAKYRTNSGYKRDDWAVDLADYVAKGGDAVDYLTMKQEYGTRNVGNGVYARDDLTVIEASTLVLGSIDGEQRAPSTFADPYAKGYEYALNSTQQARYTDIWDRLFHEGFADLYESDEYRAATPEEREELVGELRKDVTADAKREMADWLWEQGIESKLK